MSDFKVEFKLKQHTPIIHFQSEQTGATLRATELKPKLDRFLIKVQNMLNENKKPKNEFRHFFIGDGKEHLSLEYKIRITAHNVQKQSITKDILKYNKKVNKEVKRDSGFPCFFATMGKEWKTHPKYFVYAEEVSVDIICFNSKLLGMMRDVFPQFIFETNFGTRQTKGFGSFEVVSIDDERYEPTFYGNYHSFEIHLDSIERQVFEPIKYVDMPDRYFLKQRKLFEVIDLFYKTLRSGINRNGQFYMKSLLFMYAKDQGVTWDKKVFKQKFVSENEIQKQIKKHHPQNSDPLLFDTKEKYLVRDLLGLSTVQEWLSYKCRVRHPREGDRLRDKKINENAIKRYRSPLLMKPVSCGEECFRIYLVFRDVPDELFKERITVIKAHDEGRGRDKKEMIDDTIENLQFWSGFNLEKFFEYIDGQIDIATHIDKKFHAHPYYKLLDKIFRDLKEAS
jgi:hypothetical protein